MTNELKEAIIRLGAAYRRCELARINYSNACRGMGLALEAWTPAIDSASLEKSLAESEQARAIEAVLAAYGEVES